MPREFFLLFTFALADRDERDLPLARTLGGDRRADGRRRSSRARPPGTSSRSASSASATSSARSSSSSSGSRSTSEALELARMADRASPSSSASSASSAGTYAAGRVGGFTQRQSLNAGTALVARGEFTVILAQVAATNPAIAARGGARPRRLRRPLRARHRAGRRSADEGVEAPRAQALPHAA